MTENRKLPLENTQIACIELPLAGSSPALPQPPPPAVATTTSEEPPVKRHHTLGGIASVGVAVQMKKKKVWKY
jgi:hypothetical protein